jgi:hypothetical protein
VDYVTRRNPDGSASCVIGALDLLTRTSWRLEINLPANEAAFTTRSFWHNSSGFAQPYYTWMNAGIKSAGNLQFINPGTHYIGHDGRAAQWPLNPDNGRDLSWYEQNNLAVTSPTMLWVAFPSFGAVTGTMRISGWRIIRRMETNQEGRSGSGAFRDKE